MNFTTNGICKHYISQISADCSTPCDDEDDVNDDADCNKSDADAIDSAVADIKEISTVESVTALQCSDGLNTIEVLEIIRSVTSDRVLSHIPRRCKEDVAYTTSSATQPTFDADGPM